MLATVSAWLATQGASLLLGFLANIIKDAWSTYQANQAQRESGQLAAELDAAKQVAARATLAKQTSETIDAMPQTDVDALTDALGGASTSKS